MTDSVGPVLECRGVVRRFREGDSTLEVLGDLFGGGPSVAEGLVTAIRGPVAGAGYWSHQYGDPDNSTYAGESLGGASSVDTLQVHWLGRPGARGPGAATSAIRS